MRVGDVVALEPNNVAHGGVFVARAGGRVVFVSDAVDGERVLARITDDTHAAYLRAATVRVLEPSPWRREHVWEAASLERDPAERAGGAEFGHIAPARQRRLKERVVEEALARFAGLERRVEVAPPDGDDADDGTGGRTRVRLHASEPGSGAARFGPFAARSHHVVAVDDLPLAVPELAAIAPVGPRVDPAIARAVAGAATVDLIAPSVGEPILLMAAPAGRRRRGGHRRGPATRRWATDARGAALADPVVTEVVVGREFRLAAAGFWQVHRRAAATLFRVVGEAACAPGFDPAASNQDLYGGVGLLAAAMAVRSGGDVRVSTVEAYAPATAHARANLGDVPGADAVTARVDAYLARVVSTADARERERLRRASVILDPPRSGAGAAVVDALAELRPARVVYVACDPVALARDLGLFAAHGYRARGIRGFDLFPHTCHVETVAVIEPDG